MYYWTYLLPFSCMEFGWLGSCVQQPRENTPKFRVFLWLLPCLLHILQGSNAGCSWDIFRLMYVLSSRLRQARFTLWSHKHCACMKLQKLNCRAVGSDALNERPFPAPYLAILPAHHSKMIIQSSVAIHRQPLHAYYPGKYLLYNIRMWHWQIIIYL